MTYTLFYDPDRTGYPKEFIDNAIKCPGLEALTGADFCLSYLKVNPIKKTIQSPVDNLNLHITNRSLFVQVKVGYDVINFDSLKRSISRMVKCRIPKSQAILLTCGKYYEGDDSSLRIVGNKQYNDTTYKSFYSAIKLWQKRGGITENIQSVDWLMYWINEENRIYNKIQREGPKNVYPEKTPQHDENDVWQSIAEIKPNDYRSILINIDGIGNNLVQRIDDFLTKAGFEKTLTSALQILIDKTPKPCRKSEINPDGIKYVLTYPIVGWGDKSANNLRDQLGIPFDWNYTDHSAHVAQYLGTLWALENLTKLCSEGKKPLSVQEGIEQIVTLSKYAIKHDGMKDYMPFQVGGN